MSTNLARNDDLLVHNHSTERVEIKGAHAPPVPAKSSLLLKFGLAFALLLTFAWSLGLGWAAVRVVFSVF
jgi:hypothetical protein